MRINATRVVIAVFGALAGLAGVEHGIGEVLQGSTRPGGLMILSWPGSPFFEVLAGEPAMTVIPNLLVSGVLSIVLSLVVVGLAHGFAHRNQGGLALMAASVALFLVGGGFGPALLGIIVAVAALRIRSPHHWAARDHRLGRILAAAWPWALGCAIAAWLLLMPGLSLLSRSFSVDSAVLVEITIFCAFITLVLSIFTGFAHDRRSTIRRADGPWAT